MKCYVAVYCDISLSAIVHLTCPDNLLWPVKPVLRNDLDFSEN